MRLSKNYRRWRSSRKREVPSESQVLRQKFFYIRLLVITLFAILALQLVRMQIVQGGEYRLRAENNRLREVPITASRGLIYDRYGNLLVENVPSFSAAVVPADLPREEQGRVLDELATLLDVPATKMALDINAQREGQDPFSPVVLKRDLSQETAFALREMQSDLPGVTVLAEPVRSYPAGPLMAQILGYVGTIDETEYADLRKDGYLLNDRIGKTGVESTYESVLRGAPGRKQVEIDARGAEVRTLKSTAAKPGESLVLTIDLDLQKKTTELLQAAMAQGGSKDGTVVVMDVHTGEVLAMVSLPSYDDNLFSGSLSDEEFQRLLNDPGKPLVNHAVSEMYPPGSTFKQVTGVAALAEGVANPSTTITSHGYITVPNQYDPSVVYVYRDWAALGTLDFYGGVAMSSDVYFYYLAGGYYENGREIFRGLDADNLARYTRAFGLGAPTGIDLPSESAGLVPDPAWKEATLGEPWVIGDTYQFGIGQGFLAATPLQMVNVTATIANGGDVLVPRVVREIVSASGKVLVPFQRTVHRHLDVDPADLSVFREAMRQAVSWGTAERAAVPGVSVAGKTGTAEFGPALAGGEHESHAWFTGFAPSEDPQVAIVVFLEKGNGALDAAPLASQILDYYFHRKSLAEAPGSP
jgi:penicillin-binding protein 2